MSSIPQSQTDEDARMKNAMERMVDSYDSYMRTMTLGTERKLRDLTAGLAQLKPGAQVLEVGCGTGTLTLAAKRQVGPAGKAYGIDVIPKMIEACRRKAEQAGADPSAFQLGGIDDIPFPAGKFDAVLCSFMIFHMSEGVRRRGIQEIRRVLKPGGRLVVVDMALPASPVPRAIAKALFGGMLQHDLRELIPLMQEAGFVNVELAPVNYRVLFLPVLSFVRGRAGD
ncbi:MAG: methyltransferase domain-containing protein [Chloroflexi bacterium]|nr:methyltransferase domain-containing protein [Chloroflexota bacterium]